eukprot:COSAG02_NODE_3579_length_6535_cov_6.493008_2_plen_90_part_00
MSAVMHDVSHSVGGEDWRRQAAEADKSGKMMAELVKQTEMQQALFEVRHRQDLSLQRALLRILLGKQSGCCVGVVMHTVVLRRGCHMHM